MTSDQLKKERLDRGLTQAEMAKLLYVPIRTYQNWEQGRSPVKKMVPLALKAIPKK